MPQSSVTSGTVDYLLPISENSKILLVTFHFTTLLPCFNHETKYKFKHFISKNKLSGKTNTLFKVKMETLARKLGNFFKKELLL